MLFENKIEFLNSKSFLLGKKEMITSQNIDCRNKFNIVLVPMEI